MKDSEARKGTFGRIWLQKAYFRNATTDIAVTGLGFLSGIMMARGLGPEGRGQFAAAMMWPGLVGVLAALGLHHAFAYASGAGWSTPRSLHRLAIGFSLSVGMAAALLLLIITPYLYKKSFPTSFWVPAVFVWSIPISIYSGFLMSIYQGKGAFTRWNGAKFLRGGGWPLAIGVLLLMGRASVVNLLIAQIFILVLISAYLALGLGDLPSSGDNRPAPLGRLLRYGSAVYSSGIVYMVNQQLDQYLLSLWVIPEQLGQYAVAVTIAGVLLFVPGVVGPIVFSQIAREPTGSPLHRATSAKGFWLACSVIVPIGLLFSLTGPWIVRLLYGNAFNEAGELLRILGPATVFLGLGVLLADILRGIGKPILATYGTLVGAVVTVAGLAYTLPRFGIWGAAWVSLVAYFLMMCGQGLLALKYFTRTGAEFSGGL